jgi:hypothetical protein
MLYEGWQILPRVAIRATGFPIEYLHTLRYVRTTQAVSTLLGLEAELTALRHDLLESEFPRTVARMHEQDAERTLLAKCSAWRRAVGHWREVTNPEACQELQALSELLFRWNELLHSHQELTGYVHQDWEIEHARCRKRLREIVKLERVQEAIYLSNPGVYASLERYLLRNESTELNNSVVRKLERRLVAYLQRLCTKNETQSFFGPINYGHLIPTQKEALQLRCGSVALPQRCTFFSQWMVEALAATISAEPEFQPYLRPRRETSCLLLRDRRLVFPINGRTQVLDERAAWLFENANGQRTVMDLAQGLSESWTTTWLRLEQLQRWRAIVLHLLVPGDTSEPLSYLQHWISELPESTTRSHWEEIFCHLRTLADAFASAAFPERISILEQMEAVFTSACGQKARRGAGEMYVDRSLLFEECRGNLEHCVIGGSLARKLTCNLQPILDLWYTYALLQAQHDQHIAHQLWQRLHSVSGHAVSFLAYLRAAQQEIEQGRFLEKNPCTWWLQKLSDLVRAKSDGHRARLCSTDLPLVARERKQHTYTSPDVMIAAQNISSIQAGEYQIILGEGHSQPLLLVFPTGHFLDAEQRDELKAILAAKLSEEGTLTAQLRGTRTSKIFAYMLTDTQIELRPFYPDTRAIPIAAVEIRELDGSLVLWAQGHYIRLHSPLKRFSEEFDPLSPFTFSSVRPPVLDLGEHTPRIEIDDIVCQRERWVLPTDPVKTHGARGGELFLKVWRWKERYGLPQEVFVRTAHEPKPVYIDFCNYFLDELLCHLADEDDFLEVSEMLPASHQMWLKQCDGHHSCELRMMAVC